MYVDLFEVIYRPASAVIVTAVGTVFAGLIANILGKISKKEKKQVEQIAGAVTGQAQAMREKTLQTLIEKLPNGTEVDKVKDIMRDFAHESRQINNISIVNNAGNDSGEAMPLVEGLINGYHRQALHQAKVQFYFSVVAAAVGIAIIIGSLLQIDPQNLASLTKALPGTVIDAVAFLFFKQAEATRQRATELYDRLRNDNVQYHSMRTVEEISDPLIKNVVRAQLALHMAGLKPEVVNLQSLLSVAAHQSSPEVA
jgi:hypothetical protein